LDETRSGDKTDDPSLHKGVQTENESSLTPTWQI